MLPVALATAVAAGPTQAADLDLRIYPGHGGTREHTTQGLHVVVVATVADLDVAHADLLLVGRIERQPPEPGDDRLEPGVRLDVDQVAVVSTSAPALSSRVNR